MPIDTDDGRCAAVLYVMDSNDYNADDGTYAGVDAGQVAWYERRSEELERRCGAKVGALIFMHIPLPEYAGRSTATPRAWAPGSKANARDATTTACSKRWCAAATVRGCSQGRPLERLRGHAAGHRLAYGRYSGGYAEYQELVSGARVIELHRDRPGFVTWVRLASGARRVRRAGTPRP